jgi:hypothetical protein
VAFSSGKYLEPVISLVVIATYSGQELPRLCLVFSFQSFSMRVLEQATNVRSLSIEDPL